MPDMKRRSYTKVLRAAAEEATRQRIVEALVSLHEQVGPARTTVSAVAERAGVERLTVYRHFPDEPSMIRACSAHWAALHPLPSLPSLEGEPLTVSRKAIVRLYGWFRENAAMLTQVSADALKITAVAESLGPVDAEFARLAVRLDSLWPTRSSRRAATIRHVLQFSTWRSLDRLTGSDRRAAALAAEWIEGGSARRRGSR